MTSDRINSWGSDIAAVQQFAEKIRALYHRHQPIERDAMVNSDERELPAFAEDLFPLPVAYLWTAKA